MGINTTKYVRKPLYVEAVQVTEENFDELVGWCNGTVEDEEGTDKQFIRIWVHNPMGPRQTKAFVGDWILRHQKGFKIYTRKAFEASFDEVPVTTPPVAVEMTEAQARETAGLPPKPEEERLTIEEKPQVAGSEETGNPADDVEKTDTEEFPAVASEVPEEAGGRAKLDVSGKRVLSIREQREMGPEEVRELLKSGEAILAQDLNENAA